jgi:hypothetical protein
MFFILPAGFTPSELLFPFPKRVLAGSFLTKKKYHAVSLQEHDFFRLFYACRNARHSASASKEKLLWMY